MSCFLHNIEFDCSKHNIKIQVNKTSGHKYLNLYKNLTALGRLEPAFPKAQPSISNKEKLNIYFYTRFINLTTNQFNRDQMALLNKEAKFILYNYKIIQNKE
ncbi:hypothetical protein HHI36_001943 [Cryptolaemus montrouzieri]|uniref:Uncharacterized protein n=1 Tax=Cryptolaemus montrouzieri TaxID=559131 RepID=A0ABD2P970_9CUCU